MTRAHAPPPGPPAPLGDAAPLRVLVVDDHPRIREPLAQFLRREGVQAQTAADARTMFGALALAPFDAVVLDVMLPDGNGSLICAQVRREFGVPVILLTAQAEVDDRVRGLERGADDYVVKPFDPRELLARIRNVVRRHPRAADEAPAPATEQQQQPQRTYRLQDWHFDAARGRLVPPGGADVRLLGEAESRLLEVLVCHANAVLSRDQLLELTRAQGRDGDPAFDRTIDRQISRLREKLQSDDPAAPLLRTVRGGGYSLVAQVQAGHG